MYCSSRVSCRSKTHLIDLVLIDCTALCRYNKYVMERSTVAGLLMCRQSVGRVDAYFSVGFGRFVTLHLLKDKVTVNREPNVLSMRDVGVPFSGLLLSICDKKKIDILQPRGDYLPNLSHARPHHHKPQEQLYSLSQPPAYASWTRRHCPHFECCKS